MKCIFLLYLRLTNFCCCSWMVKLVCPGEKDYKTLSFVSDFSECGKENTLMVLNCMAADLRPDTKTHAWVCGRPRGPPRARAIFTPYL